VTQVPTEVELGAFAAGAVPPDLEITFTDFDNVAVDLTGFSNVQCNIEEDIGANQNPLGTGGIVISDIPGGKVTYSWVRNDMIDPGDYTLQAWVNNGTKYYESDLYLYTVYDGPEEPPV
jgi:hypothetical protein